MTRAIDDSAGPDSLEHGEPDYGNWVSRRLLFIFGIAAAALLVLSWWLPWFLALTVPCAIVFVYFAWARRRFAAHGGELQARIQGLVVEHLDWDGSGRVLDIGCGNGPLTVALALEFPEGEVTGIDYWGGQWEYSRQVCDHNAARAGVADRVAFEKASASALPFEDGAFDAAVSNLVFHEVADTADKREVIREALRVVRSGGAFAFQDLFRMKSVYGDMPELVAEIESWGVAQVAYEDTADAAFIPGALRLPFMVGALGLLYGRK